VAQPRLLGITLRWFPMLVLGVILPSVTAFLFSSSQPQVYQVSATLLPAQLRLAGNPDYNTVAMSRLVGLATNYAYAAKSRSLLSSVGQQLNVAEGVEDLSKRVDAAVDANVAALAITARASDASAAAALANAVAHAIEDQSSVVQTDESLVANLETVRERILETETEYQRLLALPPPRTAEDTQALGTSLALLRELTNIYDSLSASLNKTPGGLIVVYEAEASLAQMIAPRTLYYTLLAAIAGLLIAAGIASVLEYLDDTVKSPEDVEEAADLRTLGTIASTNATRGRQGLHELVTLHYPRSAVAEAYRALRTSIEFASVEAPTRSLLVTSSAPGEGKTIAAANLAVTFAQAGRRVVLIDADLRNPNVHQVFGVTNAHGLTSLLCDNESSVKTVVQATAQANLRILTTGPLPTKPAEIIWAQRMDLILDQLKTDVDLIIFDGPPLQVATDSVILSSLLDGTLLVVAAGRSRRGALRFGCESLARAHANVLGVVLYHGARGSFPSHHDDSALPLETRVAATRAGERGNPT